MFPDASQPDMSVPGRLANLVDTKPITIQDFEHAVQVILKAPHRPPEIDFYSPSYAARLQAHELYHNIPLTLPLPEESRAERVRRSLRFYESLTLRPPTNWLLCDPPYEATDTSRRCWRVKLKKPLEDLQRQLRARKRRRNHA